MEDLSKLIHEEIFILEESEGKVDSDINQSEAIIEKKQLAIISPSLNANEEELLSKIVSATRIDADQVIRAPKFDSQMAINWLVFSDENILSGKELKPFEIALHDDCKIILAQPLSTIAGSQDLKQQLWTSIRTLFELD